METSFTIKYTREVTEREKSIIEGYWHYEYPFFSTNTLDVLVSGYDISRGEITALIRSSCFAELHCSRCSSYMGKYANKSELNISRFFDRGSICCNDCWMEIKQPIIKEVIKEIPKPYKAEGDIIDRLRLGVELEKWRELNDQELEVLIKVTEHIHIHDILNSVFIDADKYSEYNKKYWDILHKLHDLNLIYEERVSPRGKILRIHYHGRTSQILRKEFPDLYMKREILKQVFIPLACKIERLTTKGKDTQPDYSTVIKITQERLLSKGDFIQLAVWGNEGQLKMRMIKLQDDELKKFNLLSEEE